MLIGDKIRAFYCKNLTKKAIKEEFELRKSEISANTFIAIFLFLLSLISFNRKREKSFLYLLAGIFLLAVIGNQKREVKKKFGDNFNPNDNNRIKELQFKGLDTFLKNSNVKSKSSTYMKLYIYFIRIGNENCNGTLKKICNIMVSNWIPFSIPLFIPFIIPEINNFMGISIICLFYLGLLLISYFIAMNQSKLVEKDIGNLCYDIYLEKSITLPK